MSEKVINQQQFEQYKDIDTKKFAFANKNVTHDEKFDTKAVSYLRDAFRRFAKNKASVVAAIIILLIILYAIVVPLFNFNYDVTFNDTYYSKLGPRVTWLKWLGVDGSASRQSNEAGYIAALAIGIGAADTDGTGATWEDGAASQYNAVLTTYNSYLFAEGTPMQQIMYNYKVETYYEKGFVTLQITPKQYDDIIAWEQESGLKVLYPIINTLNQYCPDKNNPNYWYKANARLVPINTSSGVPQTVTLENGLQLEDNYVRDASGNALYYKTVGNTEEREVRILYYNYYLMKNGFEPNYLLGTDIVGYDLALRLASGIRLSLLVAVFVSVINLFIGTIYGAIEGYFGGATDILLERVSDILAGIPFIVVATLFQRHLAGQVGPVVSLLFAFVLTGWIGTASRVRTQFYRFKNQEYVLAARTLGAKNRRIMFKHIFPNSLGTIITSSVLVIPSVIFSESMLSYLGIINLGGSSGTSLGTLLSDAGSTSWMNYPHLMIVPALVISLLMISFNLFGNGLRDAFNPSLRGVEE